MNDDAIFLTYRVDCIAGKPPPTRSDGHDQCRGGLVYNDERGAMGTIISV